MNALLWILVGVAAINTVGIFFDRFQTPATITSRIFDACYTLFIGGWALIILAKGGAV